MNEDNHNSPPLLRWCTGKLLFFAAVGDYLRVVLETFRTICAHPPSLRLLFKQFYDIGVTSLPVVAITGFSTGLVLAAQSFYQLSDKGLASITGIMVGKAMITELGPVLTAFMITGRVGAAMCAELGTMQVTEQVDALKTMAVNPVQYLIAPRYMGGIIMMPLLTIFSIIMGVFGGYLISVHLFGMAPSAYFDPMPLHITLFDVVTGMVKAFIFGTFIMTISCYKGMKTEGGAAGVGQSTTNSVVISYCCILLSNFFITVGLNVFREEISRLL